MHKLSSIWNHIDPIHIPVETEYTALVIRINQNRDPLVIYVGKRFRNREEYSSIPSFDA
ncbi:unnamed protein product, partial [Rotaria sp. Silwood1]